MAKNAKEIAVKGRQTKLSKKSNEELISIILRKDETERKLSNQIVNLKAEVNSLNKRISNISRDMDGTLRELNNVRDSNKVSREQIDSLRIRLADKEEDSEKDKKYIVELEEVNHSLKKVVTISIITAIVIAACWLFA